MREAVRDRERLEHIVEAINRILNFCEGEEKEDLEKDSLQFYSSWCHIRMASVKSSS